MWFRIPVSVLYVLINCFFQIILTRYILYFLLHFKLCRLVWNDRYSGLNPGFDKKKSLISWNSTKIPVFKLPHFMMQQAPVGLSYYKMANNYGMGTDCRLWIVAAIQVCCELYRISSYVYIRWFIPVIAAVVKLWHRLGDSRGYGVEQLRRWH